MDVKILCTYAWAEPGSASCQRCRCCVARVSRGGRVLSKPVDVTKFVVLYRQTVHVTKFVLVPTTLWPEPVDVTKFMFLHRRTRERDAIRACPNNSPATPVHVTKFVLPRTPWEP